MITQDQVLSIGFAKDGELFSKHELTSKYSLKLDGGEVSHIREVRGETILKYPVNVDNLRDLILAYEIISGAIIYHELSEDDNKVYSIIISFLLAIIGLFLIYFMLMI